MNLLITGGAGFIGSNFIRYWLTHYPKDRIINLDKLTYAGHLSSLKDISGKANYQFIKGDICDAKIVDNVISRVDTVVHFAAESHVDRSIKDPAVCIKTNVLGTQMLLDFAVKYHVSRFHHISTDEVYGSLNLNTKAKFYEKTSYDPHSPYSASKAASDHLVRSYFHTFGLNTSITNCSNNFGPYQDPEKYIPRMITNLLSNQKIKIYGDGKNIRDWLFVDDHCFAIDLVIKNGKPGETYCVGGQKQLCNNLVVARKILRLLGKTDKEIEFVPDRPGHDRKYAVNWGKINKELHWQPSLDFDSALKQTVDWYTNNTWWWQPLKTQSESIYK